MRNNTCPLRQDEIHRNLGKMAAQLCQRDRIIARLACRDTFPAVVNRNNLGMLTRVAFYVAQASFQTHDAIYCVIRAGITATPSNYLKVTSFLLFFVAISPAFSPTLSTEFLPGKQHMARENCAVLQAMKNYATTRPASHFHQRFRRKGISHQRRASLRSQRYAVSLILAE